MFTRRLRTILQSKYLFKILAIIVLIIDIAFLNLYEYKSVYDKNITDFKGIITDIKVDQDKALIHLKTKESILVRYYYTDNEYENIANLQLGDTIYVKGILEIPSENTVPNLFNYRKYLYNNKIYYILEANNISKIKNNTSVLYDIKNKIISRINKITKSKSYIKTFILGDKSEIDDRVSESYQNNGVAHLFSISGMHVSLFAGIIMFFLKKISYSDKYNYSIVLLFLLFYMFLVNFTASILRTFMLYLLRAINKMFNLKIKIVDLSLISLIILIFINHRIIYNIGFQYSYLISFTLILFSKKINSHRNYFIRLFITSFISFLVSIPICIYNFYQINLISIVLNLFLVPLVSMIIFPLSLITFILPFLDNILYIFIKLIENVSLISNDIVIGTITLAKTNIYIIVIYYVIIYLAIYNYKYLIFLIMLIIVHKNIKYFNPYLNIILLDVGQGDSIFIELPFNKGNILIDTGGSIYESNYSIVDSKTIPYLKSIGVDKVNYLISTHGDSDHIGEAINLVNNFKVEKIILNCGEFNDLEQSLIKVLDKKKKAYYSCIKELNIDTNKLYFLNSGNYDNENDNSAVIYTKFNNYKFLFMGDAGVDVEEDLISKYNLQDIDVLKVGHHGSKTSSSKEFIDKINPKYSIISVGENNRYGHPNKEVLENLDNSKIYRTDIDGSIMFRINNDKLKIETCIP